MKHTYALCPTRKELVWLENPPKFEEPFMPPYKPYGMSDEEFQHEVSRHEYIRAEYYEQYQQALTQAIADAPVVKEGLEEIMKAFPKDAWGRDGNDPKYNPDKNTPYEVEIEGEIIVNSGFAELKKTR